MARQFDLSAPSRGYQMEAQIGQIESQAQDTAMSFYERQQNMRLKEIQNKRQELLTNSQIKMNEANLSMREQELEVAKKQQDLLLADQKFKQTVQNIKLKDETKRSKEIKIKRNNK